MSLLPSVRSTYTTEVTERTFIIPTADYATATAHIVTSFGVLGGYLEVTGAHASDPISDAMASIPLEANPAASGQTVWLYAHYLPKIMLQWRRPGDAGWNYIDGSSCTLLPWPCSRATCSRSPAQRQCIRRGPQWYHHLGRGDD